MWKVDKLRLVNLISHEDTSYAFAQGRATMVHGKNEDDDGQESNGSGKSALMEGVAIALLGSPLRGVTMSELVMSGKDSCSVWLSMSNGMTGHRMEIARTFHSSAKPQSLNIRINGDDQTDLPSVLEGNKLILSMLAISKEDLLNYYVVAKGKYVSFFQASDTSKKELINRFSGGDLIDGVEENVKADSDAISARLALLDKQKYAEEVKMKELASQLEAAEEEAKAGHEDEIRDIRNSIERLEEEYGASQNAISARKTEVDKLKENLEKAKAAVSKLEDDEKAMYESSIYAKKELEEKNSEIMEVKSIISELSITIKGKVECPKCSHEFSAGDPSLDLKDAKESLGEAQSILVELSASAKKLGDRVGEYGQVLSRHQNSIREAKRETDRLEHSIRGSELSVKSESDRSKSIKADIAKGEDRISALSLQTANNSAVVRINESMDKCMEQSSSLALLISEESKKKTDAERWVVNFKKFKGHLANRSIDSINGFCNLYLQKIRSNLQVMIEGATTLRSGSTKDRISVGVVRDGLPAGSYDKFSAGEKTRMDVCLILGIQRLINMSATSGGLDLLILDEIIESVDRVGVRDIVRSLDSLSQTIMVVTHASMDVEYDNKVLVVKRNGSSIIEPSNSQFANHELKTEVA